MANDYEHVLFDNEFWACEDYTSQLVEAGQRELCVEYNKVSCIYSASERLSLIEFCSMLGQAHSLRSR